MLYKVGDDFSLNFNQVRARFPNVSFVAGQPIIGHPGVYHYEETPQPVYDPITQSFREIEPANNLQRWEVYDLTYQQVQAQFTEARASFIRQVDADVDDLYRAAIGNRGPEYNDAERDATAYIAAGYTGTVPAGVQSWATAKNWTATEAADDIAAAAAQLNGAKQAIRAARLLRKEQARTAEAATLPTITAQWNGFVAAVRVQLGL